MFSRTGRTLATALVVLAVVLSMSAGPAMAAQDDDGLLGGDDSDDGLLGGDAGADGGEDGVSVGGEDGVSAGTDGVSAGGDDGVEAGTDGVSAGGDDGVEAGTDGVSAGGDDGVNASTDGVSVAGQDVGGEGVPGGDDLPDGEELPGSEELPDGEGVPGGDDLLGGDGVPGGDDLLGGDGVPGGDDLPGGDGVPGGEELPGGDGAPGVGGLPGPGSGDVPTGPLPVDITYSVESVKDGFVRADSDSGPQGAGFELILSTRQRDAGGQTLFSQLEASDADRTYLDLEGDGTASERGLRNADGAIYTVNESGGTYILALSRDSLQAAGMGFARGDQAGVANVRNEPGTQKGVLVGGLNPANVAGQGPSAPVGPEAPERLGGGIICNGEECLMGTTGIQQQVPDNNATGPVRENYPLPTRIDQSGVVLPCNKPVGADDLPAERLPGLSDLPKGTLPGVPTSLLTNDAVLGLAFGAAPAPCAVSEPVADPVANPATEPGQTSPTFDADTGTVDTEDGLDVFRRFAVGPGGNLGTTDGFSAVILTPEQQAGFLEGDLSNSEYQYVLIDTRNERQGSATTSEQEASLREEYAGLDTGVENGPGTGEFAGEATPSVIQKQIVELRLECDAGGCQPSYSGLPSLGALPEIPNPLAGDAELPA